MLLYSFERISNIGAAARDAMSGGGWNCVR